MAETLFLVPVSMKKTIQPGADAKVRADKLAGGKWGRPFTSVLEGLRDATERLMTQAEMTAWRARVQAQPRK